MFVAIYKDEGERPTEWLRHLTESHEGYGKLVEDAGSLAIAAYHLARARCRVQPVALQLPTALELEVAAKEIRRHVSVEHSPDLVVDCERAGLPVIVPQ